MNALHTDADLAERFQITLRRLHDLRRRHGWPCVRLGKNDFRFTDEQVAEIERLMTHQATTTTGTSTAATVAGQTQRSASRRRSA